MSTPAGSPGTAGRGYRIPAKEGRHRAPPEPPPPDRFIAPIAAAAVLLTFASLIAIYATGIAPDATTAGRHGLAVSTAARSARTVHVPLTVLPVPVPVIPTPTPIENALSRPQSFAGSTGTATVSTALTADPVATTDPLTPDQQPATQPEATTTTAPPASSTAAATTTSSATDTEEPTVTAEPTADPTPTDIGDVIDQILEDAIGEGS